MKTEICIISCGAKKIWDKSPSTSKTPAKDAYIGPLFKKCKSFAETFFPSSYFILSDKYGLINPNQEILDYNIPPSVIKGNQEFIKLVSTQAANLGLKPINIVTTCGEIHQSIIRSVFTNAKIINPLSGLGQGKRMQKLNLLMENRK